MRASTSKVFNCLVLFLLVCQSLLIAQAENSKLESEVVWVEVNIRILSGYKVLKNYQPEDIFSLKINESNHDIDETRLIDVHKPSVDTLRLQENEGRVDIEDKSKQRYFLLFFHQIQNESSSFHRSVNGAKEFVDSYMLNTDKTGLVFFDKVVQKELSFTADKNLILKFLNNIHVKQKHIKMSDNFHSYLQEFAISAPNLKGQVNLILIAEGMKGIAAKTSYKIYNRTIQLLNAANVTVYGLDVGGLNLKDPGARVASFGRAGDYIKQSFNLGLYSQPTGGSLYRYSNDINKLFRKVEGDCSRFFTIGFYLPRELYEADEVKLEIRCKASDVKMVYKDRLYPKVIKQIRMFNSYK